MSKLIEQLKRHEGVRTHAYQCTANMTTVGVGRNIDEDGGLGLSVDEIEFCLKTILSAVSKSLLRCLGFQKSTPCVKMLLSTSALI